MYPAKDIPSNLDTSFPPTCSVNSIDWDFDHKLANTMNRILYHVLSSCPSGAHTCSSQCQRETNHLGSHITGYRTPKNQLNSGNLKQELQVPNISTNINNYTTACSICPKVKVSRTFPAGKIMPLTNTYGHMLLWISSGIYQNHTGILVIIYWFSKALQLIPLPILTTAFEHAELLFHHVFRYFSIPEDISIRSPYVPFYGELGHHHQPLFGVPPSI